MSRDFEGSRDEAAVDVGQIVTASDGIDHGLPYEELARELTAVHIATPVEDLVGFVPDDSLDKATRTMEERQFDYAPVFADGRLIGRVSRKRAAAHGSGSVHEVVEPLTSSFLASADSPIQQVIRWFLSEPWLLLIDGRDPVGLVTPADLNRQPVRVYFYMLISDFEIRLADLLRGLYPNQSELLDMLPRSRREQVEHRYMALVEADVDVDRIGAFALTDLCRVAGKSAAVLRILGLEKSRDWQSETGDLIGFRHQVMHPTRPLVKATSDVGRLVVMDERLRGLLLRLPEG